LAYISPGIQTDAFDKVQNIFTPGAFKEFTDVSVETVFMSRMTEARSVYYS